MYLSRWSFVVLSFLLAMGKYLNGLFSQGGFFFSFFPSFFFSSEIILDITFNSLVALFSKKWARTRVGLGVCFVSVGSSARVGDRSVCAVRRCYVLLGEILHSSIRSVLQCKPSYRFCLLSGAVHLSMLFLSPPSAFELRTGQD